MLLPAPDGLMSINVKVTVLVGGVGGARFLLGVQHLWGWATWGFGESVTASS